ncbi:hypothetical protein [Nocardia sp. NPDC060259]|uniref:hypothetical protein n=1 Tax=Nocardia sp. NPDC060259 TaxID=3347088 RepID=UPI003666CD1E
MAVDERPSCPVNPTTVRWQTITDRRGATELEMFSCTTPRPQTSSGRKMPHPKPWERAAQSIIRQSPKCLKAGNILIVGRREDSEEIIAAAHLIFEKTSPPLFAAHVAAIGISVTARGQGGKVADGALDQVCRVVGERAHRPTAGPVLVTANIHTRNYPSQLLFERAGFEPLSLPVGEHQQWIRNLGTRHGE